MKNIVRLILLFAIMQLIGCASSSPVADETVTREAVAAQSDKNLAKLYLIRKNAFRNSGLPVMFEVKGDDTAWVEAGSIDDDEYLYLKFDEGDYPIRLSVSAFGMRTDLRSFTYSARPGAVDMMVCTAEGFNTDECVPVPFDSELAKLNDVELKQGAVSRFKSSEYTVYSRAKKADTINAYQAYLKKFPNAQFRHSVEKRVAELKAEK